MGCCGSESTKEVNKTCFNPCQNKKDLLESIKVLSRNTKTNDYFLISKETLGYPVSIFKSNFLENSKNTKFLYNYNDCIELAKNNNKENEFIIICGSINENMKSSDSQIKEKRVNIKFSNNNKEMKIEFPNGKTINFEENNNKAFKFVNQGKNVNSNSEANNNNINKTDKLSLNNSNDLNNKNISIFINNSNINNVNMNDERNKNILTLNDNKSKNMNEINKDIINDNLSPNNIKGEDNSISQNIINNPQLNNKTDNNITNKNNNYNKKKNSYNSYDNNDNNSILNLNYQNKDKNNISKSSLEGGFMEVTIGNNKIKESESNDHNEEFCKITKRNSENKVEIDKNIIDNNLKNNCNGDFMEVTIENNGKNKSNGNNGGFYEISENNIDNRNDVYINNKIDNDDFNNLSGAFCEISKYNIDNKNKINNNNMNNDIINNNENNNNKNNGISDNVNNIEFAPNVDENNENHNDINNINCFNNPPLISIVKINENEYINISLQTLSNIAPLTNYFLSYKQKLLKIQKNSNDKKISKAYSDVIYNLWDKNNIKGSFRPVYFNEIISEEEELILSGGTETATKNLIGFLYRKLHDELNEINPNNVFEDYNESNQNDPKVEFYKSQKNFNLKNKSIITDIFFFNKANIAQCLECGTLTYSFTMESFLIFPLEKVNQNNNNNSPNLNIKKCFEYYTRKTINPDYVTNCKFCKKFGKYTFYERLSTLPEVLTIFLYKNKNKEFNGDFQIDYILDNLNFYMINIDNNPNNYRYELIGIVIERGSSGIDKRFFTYSKSPVDKKWYLYNDSNIKYIPEPNQEIRGIPFLLYYQKIKDNL